MQDWQQRVIEEYDELKGRTDKLETFRNGDSWDNLDVIDQTLLENQYLFMVGYGNILEKRIERFEGDQMPRGAKSTKNAKIKRQAKRAEERKAEHEKKQGQKTGEK